jgi:uncharacterized protein
VSDDHSLCTIAELEDAVGQRPPGAGLKSISLLDEHCHTLLAVSTFSVVGARASDGTLNTFAVGGAPGCVAPADPHTLVLPRLPDLQPLDGAPAGLLALIPGYRETLRVNGTLAFGDEVHLHVDEAFLHCAKAMIRSRFWEPAPTPEGGADVGVQATNGFDEVTRAFLARAPFVALSSVDGNDRADVSPKGDPPGFLHVLDDQTVAIPDRPGNRRTDTMHNLIERPEIGMLALAPGDERVLEVRGRARITNDPLFCAPMAVQGKTPTAALVIAVDHVELRHERAITDAALWDTRRHVPADALPRASRIWVDHVKLNEDPGVTAKAMRALVNERTLAAGLRRDYSHNLY